MERAGAVSCAKDSAGSSLAEKFADYLLGMAADWWCAMVVWITRANS
jgi:hypothetical protein